MTCLKCISIIRKVTERNPQSHCGSCLTNYHILIMESIMRMPIEEREPMLLLRSDIIVDPTVGLFKTKLKIMKERIMCAQEE